MFSLFNFSSIFLRGVSRPHLPLCADAHGMIYWLVRGSVIATHTQTTPRATRVVKGRIYGVSQKKLTP